MKCYLLYLLNFKEKKLHGRFISQYGTVIKNYNWAHPIPERVPIIIKTPIGKVLAIRLVQTYRREGSFLLSRDDNLYCLITGKKLNFKPKDPAPYLRSISQWYKPEIVLHWIPVKLPKLIQKIKILHKWEHSCI